MKRNWSFVLLLFVVVPILSVSIVSANSPNNPPANPTPQPCVEATE